MQCIINFKKMTKIRANYPPGETSPYVNTYLSRPYPWHTCKCLAKTVCLTVASFNEGERRNMCFLLLSLHLICFVILKFQTRKQYFVCLMTAASKWGGKVYSFSTGGGLTFFEEHSGPLNKGLNFFFFTILIYWSHDTFFVL